MGLVSVIIHKEGRNTRCRMDNNYADKYALEALKRGYGVEIKTLG